MGLESGSGSGTQEVGSQSIPVLVLEPGSCFSICFGIHLLINNFDSGFTMDSDRNPTVYISISYHLK